MKHLYFTVGVSSTVLFFLREINRFLEALSSFCIFEKALFLDPRDSRLDTLDSIFERFKHRGSRIKSQGSSFECQLTFERYCTGYHDILQLCMCMYYNRKFPLSSCQLKMPPGGFTVRCNIDKKLIIY